MSENIGKHVFEIRNEWVWYRGTIERETEQTWFFGKSGRKPKSSKDFLVPASIDPSVAEKAYRSRYHDFREAITEAQKALTDIKREAREAAQDAMLVARGGGQP